MPKPAVPIIQDLMTEAQQPSLFGFQQPRFKYPPITKQRIQEAKAQMEKKDYLGCADTLRDLRYKLEDFANRINTKPK